MSNRHAEAAAIQNERLTDHNSTAWTYRRPTGSLSVTVYITEERQRLRVSDRQGNTRVIRPEFVGTFSAAELILGGSVVEPQEGDTIERAFGSTTKKFRVTPMVQGEPVFFYTDPQQNRIRLFAKRVTNA